MPDETIPRRADIRRHTPAERAITDAMQAVEEMAADVRLTQAVILLGRARDLVADYIDGVPYKEARRRIIEDAARPLKQEVDRLTRELREAQEIRQDLEHAAKTATDAVNDLMDERDRMAAQRNRIARFDALAREAGERLAPAPGGQHVAPHGVRSLVAILTDLAALAGPAVESPVAPPPVHDDDTGHQEATPHA